MKDLHSNIKPVSILHAVVVAGTANSGDIDLAGFGSAEFLIDIGVDAGTGLGASHNLVFTLTHAPESSVTPNTAGTYVDIAAGDVLGVTPTTNIVLTIDSTDEDNTLYRFGYVGGNRYVKLTWTETGTVSCPISIILVKGDPLDSPTSAN